MALFVNNDVVRQIELSGSLAEDAPFLEILSRLVELDDAGGSIAVGDVDVSVAIKRNVCGTIEDPISLRSFILAAEHEEHASPRIEFQPNVPGSLGCPQVCVG